MKTMAEIRQLVANHFDISEHAIMSQQKGRNISRPRQLAMYYCRKYTQHSLPQIGDFFQRDHTTVMHACRAIMKAAELDPMLKSHMKVLDHALSAFSPPIGEEGYLMRQIWGDPNRTKYQDEGEAMNAVWS